MAPEHPPSLVIFDARIENDTLRGSCEYIEPSTPGTRLQVRWAVESQPEGFAAVGGGVAYIYTKNSDFNFVPISKDASPVRLGDDRYRWIEGLNAGVPWVMFILILPRGHTLAEPSPAPAGARVFGDRLALYWVLRGDDLGRTEVVWTLRPLRTEPNAELVRLNQLVSGTASTNTSSLTVDDASRLRQSASSAAVQRNPWVSGSFYLIASVTIIVVLAVISRFIDIWALPAVLIAGLLLVTIIGALQLRNDEALKDETFLTLMVEALKRLPLLGAGRSRGRTR